ncbi:MAG: hypothetical protein ABW022_15840 [Actinoplanes sp.]
MNAPENVPSNDRYVRRLSDPSRWPSNRAFADRAVEQTRQRVNELSWEFAGLQVAGEAEKFLAAQAAREERWRLAQSKDFGRGDPGE